MDEEDIRTIWCGNISEKVTEEILYELFLQAGPVQRVSIPKSKDGKQKAFAFVTFKHQCSVPYAIALFEGTELFNRELNMKSRNPARVNAPHVQVGSGNMGIHNRSQSLPINFGASTFPGEIAVNALSLMGPHLFMNAQQLLNPVAGLGTVYASQRGASQYLGGVNKFSELSARSLQGNWSNRNHPYAHTGNHRHRGDRSRRH